MDETIAEDGEGMDKTERQHGEPSDPELRDSLERARAVPDVDMPDVRAMLGRLRSGIAAERATAWGRLRARLSALPTALRLRLAVATALLAGSSALLVPRVELHEYPFWRMALATGLLIALLWPVLSAAQRPWHKRALSSGTAAAWLAAALGAAFALALLPQAHVLLPHTAPPPGATLFEHAWPCLRFGVMIGLPVFVVSRLLDRGTAHAGLMAATAAGLAGNLALQLHCPITEPVHLVAGHATASVAALGLLALTWLPAFRRLHTT